MHRQAVRRGRGSSPRVRGTPSFATAAIATLLVHPRVCGELKGAIAPGRSARGSSPRVRGTRCSSRPYRRGCRFIPACAGNSSTNTHPKGTLRGSSPRVRGTRPRAHIRARQRRFIPACAGNSPSSGALPPSPPVHPRVCGELDGRSARRSQRTGSSPRVRGTLPNGRQARRARRFIPACAGNSWVVVGVVGFLPVHPRVCGELNNTGIFLWRDNGSSPRVRGTPPRIALNLAPTRFIPACAGNSVVNPLSHHWQAVHPRVCGELAVRALAILTCAGSSPRVRGTPIGVERGVGPGRFIPACAGNSHLALVVWRPQAVHPRVCGELSSTQRLAHAAIGSSPRVRGTPRAGGGVSTACSVHPRVCGELALCHQDAPIVFGSSPRVRGTRWSNSSAPASSTVHPRVCGELPESVARHAHRRRFIPACAGNSEASMGAWRSRRGSSPRVRGTPRRLGRALASATVHPRVCGELGTSRA